MSSKEAGIPGEFPFHQWNYHESIKNGDMGIATNPLENINPKLKSKMDRGYLTQKSAFGFELGCYASDLLRQTSDPYKQSQ